MTDETKPHLAVTQKVWEQVGGKWVSIVQMRVMNGSDVPQPQNWHADFSHRNEKDARAAAARAVEKLVEARTASLEEERTPWELVAELPLLKGEYPPPNPMR